jgi:hypothetical protein
VRKFQDDGTLVTTYAVEPELGGSNAIDLAHDQTTLLYTSVGREIKSYDIGTDAQLPDYMTLPPAEQGEIARGLRILPDSTVLVVDTINIKRVFEGSILNTYSIPGQVDWGTIALSPDGTEFWVANRADGAVSAPMIAKFEVATGDVLLTITGEDLVPDTGGGMCSGGVTVIGGFRAALGPPPTPPEPTPTPVGPGFNTRAVKRRWLRRSPIFSKENARVRYNMFQLDCQTGTGNNAEPGMDPQVYMSYSDDWGQTWSFVMPMPMGMLGKYNQQLQWWRLGVGRARVFEVYGSDPVKVALIDGFCKVDPGTDSD